MLRHRGVLTVFFALLILPIGRTPTHGGQAATGDARKQERAQDASQPPREKGPQVPDLRELIARPQSELHDVVQIYEADRGNLNRFYAIPTSPTRHTRLKRFHTAWLAALDKLDPDKLSEEGRTDYSSLKDKVQRELRQLDEQASAQAEIASLIPFAPTIINLEEARRQMEKLEAARVAGLLNEMKKQVAQTRRAVETGLQGDDQAGGIKTTKEQATRAAETVAGLRTHLRNWFGFYNSYDPLFTWWMAEPYKEADQALQEYATFLREKVAGQAPEQKSEPRPEQKDKEPAVAPRNEADAPDLLNVIARPRSELRGVIQRYQADRGSLSRVTAFPGAPTAPPRSAERLAQLTRFCTDWTAALGMLDFEKLSHDGRIDYLLLKNQIQRELQRLDLQARAREEVARLTPFEPMIRQLEDQRRQKDKVEPAKAVSLLQDLKKQIEQTRLAVEAGLRADGKPDVIKANEISAGNALETLKDLGAQLKEWFEYASGADSSFAQLAGDSYKEADQGLQDYAALLRDKIVQTKPRDASGITGRPIGREALLAELAGELIPYTPEELIAIAEQEFNWCEAEIKKASRAMGFGDDWQRAVEKVKTLHVEPGKQPELIRDLAREAIDYVEKYNLVTVPPLARETWRMEMMSPQRQLVNPFFTGGEVISVSFPTHTMSHEAKLQSMRGNNIPFARATVQHELIPGHHLQGFMAARSRSYRGAFSTAFWTEGWALYWEMVLYARGDFAKTPEDRVGMLVWRTHRCARIVFSLNFHLGKMSPQECIDYLVKRVGFEYDNAAAEVRRSFVGSYGPLYQAAYMLGGLQIRELRKELVDSGKMTERDFHDAVLQENRIPIALLRASLTQQKLSPDYQPDWKFYGPNP